MAEEMITEEIALTKDDNSVETREDKKNKSKKLTVIITYVIALLCLWAGLLVPLYNFKWGSPISTDNMMLKYVPYMFNGIFGKQIIKNLHWFFNSEVFAYKFDFLCLVGVLYAVVCVLALIMLIPVIAGKKGGHTSARCALAVEVIALVVTACYIAYDTYYVVKSESLKWADFNFFIPLGGVMLMAIIQSISSKGGIGVSKTIAVILAALAVFAILDIKLFIPVLAKPLNALSNTLHGGEVANFIGGKGLDLPSKDGLGIDGVTMLLERSVGRRFPADAISRVAFCMLIPLPFLVLLNFICDIFGLGTGKKLNADGSPAKNAFINIFDVVRYALTLLVAILLLVFVFVNKDLTVGVYLVLLAVLLLIQLMNVAIRTAVVNHRVKAYEQQLAEDEKKQVVINDPAFTGAQKRTVQPFYAVAEEQYVAEPEQPAVEEEPVVYEQEDYSEEEEEPEVEEEQEATPEEEYSDEEEEEEIVYTPPTPTPVASPVYEQMNMVEEEKPAEPTTVYIYGGDTDEFIDTLTDAEKVEFVEVFIKRSKGIVNGVPQYKINGDNGDFFPAVFVHINRYRNTVSDALMSKLYKQLGKIM